jgi:MHS family proline/betaine transporter-like MFS transporter
VPLVASIVLLALAAWVRSSVSETPEFVAAQQRSEERPGPLRVLRRYPGTIAVLLLSYAGPACIYPMVTTFGVAHMKSAGGLASSTTFAIFLFAQLIAIGTALLGGRTADRIGPRNAMLVALTSLGIFFVPLFPVIGSGNVLLIGICTTGVVASIIFALAAQAPFYAYAFPVRMRYFGSSIAYTATNVIFGGTAAVVATWLLDLGGGDIRGVMIYGSALVMASFLAVCARPAHPAAEPETETDTA